jgi:hypothetical protein
VLSRELHRLEGPVPRCSFYYVDAAGRVRDQARVELAGDDARQHALATARNLMNMVASSLAANWRGWATVVKTDADRELCSYPIQMANSLV